MVFGRKTIIGPSENEFALSHYSIVYFHLFGFIPSCCGCRRCRCNVVSLLAHGLHFPDQWFVCWWKSWTYPIWGPEKGGAITGVRAGTHFVAFGTIWAKLLSLFLVITLLFQRWRKHVAGWYNCQSNGTALRPREKCTDESGWHYFTRALCDVAFVYFANLWAWLFWGCSLSQISTFERGRKTCYECLCSKKKWGLQLSYIVGESAELQLLNEMHN